MTKFTRVLPVLALLAGLAPLAASAASNPGYQTNNAQTNAQANTVGEAEAGR